MNDVLFSDLKGQIITDIVITNGGVIDIITQTGKYKIYHERDCCEIVRLDKIIGYIDNVLKYEITLAESDNSSPDWDNRVYTDDSHTWSSYFLETVKGRVEFWFLGESNGYYCETTQFIKLN